MTRPTIDESERLEILPWGRTKEDQERLDTKKEQGRRGWRGCLLQLLLVAGFVIYTAGYLAGMTYKGP